MRMVRTGLIALAMIVAMAVAGTSYAGTVNLFVDSAPNVYGSPNWAPWWASAKTDVVNGSFTNMRTGTYPGTNFANPLDFIVYSDDDLGKRVHWIYWIPNETTTSLQNRFQVKFAIDWAGDDLTWDWNVNNWALDEPEKGWVQPGSWENYNDGTNQGVIGSFGFAFWAQPDSSQKYALAADILQNQTYLNGLYRIRDDINSSWDGGNLNLTVIPLPASALMSLAGLGVVVILVRRGKVTLFH